MKKAETATSTRATNELSKTTGTPNEIAKANMSFADWFSKSTQEQSWGGHYIYESCTGFGSIQLRVDKIEIGWGFEVYTFNEAESKWEYQDSFEKGFDTLAQIKNFVIYNMNKRDSFAWIKVK